MKIFTLAAAGIVALTALSPVAAGAQTRVVTTRTVTHTRTHTGPALDRHHTRRVCHMERHGHRNVRVCRTTRY